MPYPSHRMSPRPRGGQRDYTAMTIAFLGGALFPTLVHGMSLFVESFLPIIVFATGRLLI